MSEQQAEALARLWATDEAFVAAMSSATSVPEAVAIARSFGVDASAADFRPEGGALSDRELERVSGGAAMNGTFEPSWYWVGWCQSG